MAKKNTSAPGAEENDQADPKTEGQKLAEKLFFEPKNRWDEADGAELAAVEGFARDYKKFLDRGKTEREFIAQALELLKARDFTDMEALLGKDSGGVRLEAGSRVYQNIRGKSLVFAVIGEEPLSEGITILGAHVDSPRIDLKTNPLYEDSFIAMLDTHYYGGIKHYQWTAIPLAMHGTLIGKDGERQDILIGEDEDDPVLTITDLLPHLARDQMQKKAAEFIDGEGLDALAGSRPYRDKKAKDRVKLGVLDILNRKYGITEDDFAGAEIELVPAFKARDLGLDRSMIGAYGHDDRCCAYPALRAMLDFAAPGAGIPRRTLVCLFTDKEEIGSVGNTGAESRLFENFAAWLCALGPWSSAFSPDLDLRRGLQNSFMLSADVNAAYDPNYEGVYDKKTASYFGKGLVLSKYTGRGGKIGGSDANAEYCRKVQGILEKNGVPWQYGALGKVDKGGGGTIAKDVANLGVDVLDCGVPVLSMHSPFEVISKIDLYTAYRAFAAFLKDA